MIADKKAPIPSASDLVFHQGISHPDLWLWDSWTLNHGSNIHLYCLALNRKNSNGAQILPQDRNSYSFHVRHFCSADDGHSWRDLGCLTEAGQLKDGSDSHNIWSGSVTRLNDKQFLFAHTGIRAIDQSKPFVQSINAALSATPDSLIQAEEPLLCPLRDYEAITGEGYFLGDKNAVGSADGDPHGPIMALRDPYTFVDQNGQIHLFFSAKVAARRPAVGHAILKTREGEIQLEKLHAPIELPDADLYTQAEVPKVYFDTMSGRFYMLVAACDRLYENQPDDEITKCQRLYIADDVRGPWKTHNGNTSLLMGLDDLFGASIVEFGASGNEMRFVAPYTEMVADKKKQLTFAPVVTLKL